MRTPHRGHGDRNHHGAVGHTTVTTGRSAESGRRRTLLPSSGNKPAPDFVLLHDRYAIARSRRRSRPAVKTSLLPLAAAEWGHVQNITHLGFTHATLHP